jgi:hypothetical protein
MLVDFFHRALRAATVLATLTVVAALIRGDAQAQLQAPAALPVVIRGKVRQPHSSDPGALRRTRQQPSSRPRAASCPSINLSILQSVNL